MGGTYRSVRLPCTVTARRRCPRVASARASSPPMGRGHFFSRARRRNISPCGEKGRDD
ncbi:hypothetical protein BHM03_00037020, partial [Ensete ventricosum]